MKPVLTGDEYRRVDKAYEGDVFEAMDRAGHAVALAAVRAGAAYGRKVAVLAGPGNNGGDGYVAARYLSDRGAHVEIAALGEPKTPESSTAAGQARSAGVNVSELGSPFDADVVVDAVFGGGVRGGMPASVLAWMDTTAPVVAVDYPTGLDPDTGTVDERAFRARETVTFSTLKTGHVRGFGPDVCGTVTVADIGIHGGEPSMFIAERADAPRPVRPRSAHKWSAGSVLVVGGSTGMVGAAVLAGRAALNFGAGSVVLCSPRIDLVQQAAPDLLSYTVAEASSNLARFDVVVAGPGLANVDVDEMRPLIRRAHRVVLDAGGLTPSILSDARAGDSEVIITPHDGEFARIAGVEAGAFAMRTFANKERVTVVRKGNPTMISDGGPPVLVTTGGSELASIGTGDVLSGMIAALWARGVSPTSAAISGAYWHGVTGADLRARRTVTAAALAQHIARFAW